MKLDEANSLAWNLMIKHGLVRCGWTFKFDRAKKRLGCCNFTRKVISLSEHLTELNEKDQVEDTILHEIAHALAGPRANHGPKWRAKAIEVGAKPTRCSTMANGVEGNYILRCEKCELDTHRFRLPRKRNVTWKCGRCGSREISIINNKEKK